VFFKSVDTDLMVP